MPSILRRLTLSPLTLFEHALDVLALEFLERHAVVHPHVAARQRVLRSLSGKSCEWMTSVSARIAARSMVFSSSRTLPGHA